MIGNKITDKITVPKKSKYKSQHDQEIENFQEMYLPPVKRQEVIDKACIKYVNI